MTVAWFEFRVACRSRWKIWTAIGLLAGLAAGVVMVAVAGARRTDSALQRVVVDQRVFDVDVNPNNGALTDAQWRQIEQASQVTEFAQSFAAPMVPLEANGKPDTAWFDSVRGGLTLESPDGFELHKIDRPGVVAGRVPSGADPDALVVNETAARLEHLHVGSTMHVGFFDAQLAETGSPDALKKLPVQATLTVVGIIRPLDDATRAADDPRLTPMLFLTQARSRQIVHLGYLFGGLRVRLHSPGDLTAFEQTARRIAGANVLEFEELSGTRERANRANRPYVLALWAFAALAALAGMAVVVQIATRQQRLEAEARSTLRALGETRADFVRASALRGMFIGGVAAAVAAAVAIAGSTLMPIGPLRALDPHRGVDVDVTVLSVGVIAVVVLLIAHGMFIASRRSARVSVRRHRLSDAVTGRSSSPTVVTGVGFALDPGRGDAAIPVRSTAFGVGLAVSALVATIVFAAGLTHFTTTPKMYGWVWSYQVEPSGSVTAATLEHAATLLEADPHIRAEAVGAYAQVTITGKTIGAVAVQSGHGVPIVETLNGRAPQTPDEIALGAQTLRSLHRGVGDTVAVNIGGVTRQFEVVGRAVFARFAPYPASEPTGLGVGAAMTLDGLTRFGALDDSAHSPLAAGPFVLVDAKPGTSPSVLVRLAFHGDADAGLVLGAQRPSFVESYQHLERTPLALAGLLVALAIATIVHLLVSLLRRRRRDLALLRALGFTKAQLRASVLVQATTLIALTLVVAIPLGVLAGRLLWRLTSDWLGIPLHVVVPLGLVGLVALLALLVGNVVALVPATAAARVNPSRILRSE